MKKDSPWIPLRAAWMNSIAMVCVSVVGSHLVKCSDSHCPNHANLIPGWVDNFVLGLLALVILALLGVHWARLEKHGAQTISVVLNVLALGGLERARDTFFIGGARPGTI